MRSMKTSCSLLAVAVSTVIGLGACDSTSPELEKELQDSGAVPVLPTIEKSSANVARNPLKNAYFGDVHVHTGNSFDAFVFGVRRTPDDAYRFAKGEVIKQDAGFDIQLQGPPLDFLAVTDHGEYLGIVPAMADPSNPLSQTDTAKKAFGESRSEAVNTFQKIGLSFVMGNPIEEIRDQPYMDSVWAKTVDAAERHNEPGVFTAFAGYEFTAMQLVDLIDPGAINLHRNVLFKGAAPKRVLTTLDSGNPEDLWRWMSNKRERGVDSLAIPHNSNASNGEMFAQTAYDGATLTKEIAELRAANEPLVEITQIKGTSDAHPLLSPNDEWADFEPYPYLIGSTKANEVKPGSFVRQALSRGLEVESKFGVNPYEFGVIGSSDTHVAAGTFLEEKHWGKFPKDGYPKGRNSVPKDGDTWGESHDSADPLGGKPAGYYSASGLAGVWAEANTRDDLFAAMRSRETFGTSGPRMAVRLFAGDFSSPIAGAENAVERAYAEGSPMGSIISGATKSPTFLAFALQDPRSAPLQRMQMIKVWNDEGEHQEAVFDIACAGGVAPDAASHRCPDNGARVDLSTCATDPGVSAASFEVEWQDPGFVAGQKAAYYIRVLENPTCRWSTWDAVRNGTPPNPELPALIQERAWSSPIWLK